MLRWSVSGKSGSAGLTFRQVPADIRSYRWVRLKVRIKGKPEGDISVHFQDMKGYLTGTLRGLERRWREIEVALPGMVRREDFDPEKVLLFRFTYYGSAPFELEIDDIELVKGAGGWERTGAEQTAHVFGRDRVRKVKEIETDLSLSIRKMQDRYKMWAVLLPPIPPLLLAIGVFITRRIREREGVVRSRLR